MTTLADDIKRLRDEYHPTSLPLHTVNALVELLSELYDPADAKQESDALAKAAPIAALAKGE